MAIWRTASPGAWIAFGLGLVHFGMASVLGERSLASYFTWAWVGEIAAFLFLPVIVWLTITVVTAIKCRVPSPIRFLVIQISAERGRFANAALLLLAYALVNRSYRAIKVAIPRIQEFYADPIFIVWDRAIFGTDPWRITHAMIGETGTRIIDGAYFAWVTVVLIAYGFAAFVRDPRFQLQSTITYLLIWILLGNAVALGLSSAGPCYVDDFFGSNYFAQLMARLESQDTIAVQVQDFLLQASGDESIGTGISAMPSVHCGLTMLIVLMVYRRGGWKWAVPAVIYHAMILVGSVHLGWHYAVDGIVSTAVVPLIWFAVGRTIDQFSNRQTSSA